MVLKLPTEIIYYIFDFSVFGLYNENYIDYPYRKFFPENVWEKYGKYTLLRKCTE